jgi:subfamily B ATP-binding cassette protein MsbA
VGERVIATIRRELYTHIQGMAVSFFASLHSAELMTRVVNDVNRLARLSSSVLVMAIRQIGTIVALLVVMFVREWVLALIALTAFPLVGLTIRMLGRQLYKINKRAQQKASELNVVLQESFTGTKIVKAFGRETLEQQRFDGVNGQLLRLALKDHRVDELAEPLMEILGRSLSWAPSGTAVPASSRARSLRASSSRLPPRSCCCTDRSVSSPA